MNWLTLALAVIYTPKPEQPPRRECREDCGVCSDCATHNAESDWPEEYELGGEG